MKLRHLIKPISWLLVFSISLLGQEKIESKADRQVLLNISVINDERESVNELKAEHFRLYENKKPLEITNFNGENSPASVIFLLDVSPSMRPLIDQAREGILTFLENGNSQNEYSLIVYGKRTEVLSEFSDLQKTIEVVRASSYFSKIENSRSATFDAVKTAFEKFATAKNKKKVLVLLSDGEDNRSSTKIDDIEKLVKEKNILIYFYFFFSEKQDPYYRAYSPFLNIVPVSGGSVINPIPEIRSSFPIKGSKVYTKREYFFETFSLLSKEIKQQFLIGFEPAPDDGKNKWRNLEVKLELPKELKKKYGELFVRHRKGYYPLSEIVTEK